VGYYLSDQEDPSIYFSNMDGYALQLFNSKKGVIFYNDSFIYGMLGDVSLLNEEEFKKFLEGVKISDKELKYKSFNTVSLDKKKKVSGIYKFSAFHKFDVSIVKAFLNRSKFVQL